MDETDEDGGEASHSGGRRLGATGPRARLQMGWDAVARCDAMLGREDSAARTGGGMVTARRRHGWRRKGNVSSGPPSAGMAGSVVKYARSRAH